MARPRAPKPPKLRPRPLAALGHVLRAGTLGAGAWLFVVGTLLQVREVGPHVPDGIILLPPTLLVAPLVLGLGFPTRPTSFVRLAGRIVGSMGFGLVLGAMTVAIGESIGRGPLDRSFTVFSLVGLVEAALALGSLHRDRVRGLLTTPSPARTRTLAIAGVVALALLGLHSPTARCLAGSGRACRDAAILARASGIDEGPLRRRGCALGDGPSCAQLGDIAKLQDPTRAASLYEDACTDEVGRGCEELATLRLESRCDHQSATACRELADRSLAEPGRRSRYLRAACLLGDDDACAAR